MTDEELSLEEMLALAGKVKRWKEDIHSTSGDYGDCSDERHSETNYYTIYRGKVDGLQVRLERKKTNPNSNCCNYTISIESEDKVIAWKYDGWLDYEWKKMDDCFEQAARPFNEKRELEKRKQLEAEQKKKQDEENKLKQIIEKARELIK